MIGFPDIGKRRTEVRICTNEAIPYRIASFSANILMMEFTDVHPPYIHAGVMDVHVSRRMYDGDYHQV
jgi:hypothetical protein